jgi:hypothetical protein
MVAIVVTWLKRQEIFVFVPQDSLLAAGFNTGV